MTFVPEQAAIQATQHIISLLENSKLQSEEALDTIAGVFSVIDATGKILKGNKALSDIFEVNYEYLLGRSMGELFSEENRQLFSEHLLGADSKEKAEFKLDLVLKNGAPRNYLWTLKPLRFDRANFPRLFTVVGHDVTDLTKATKENARMQYELTTAKIVQTTFFPPPVARFGKSCVASFFDTATECGGDWWSYRVVKDKLHLWIGDVTGHGVSAALVVSAVHSVVSIIEERELSPAKTLELLNKVVGSMTEDPLVMTFLAATIDLKSGECTYASAGHEPIIVIPHDKTKMVFRDLQLLQGEPSFSLGMNKAAKFEEAQIKLHSGDRLLFCTDGLYDIASPSGTQWNRSAFHRNLAKLITQPQNAEQLVAGLKNTIDNYRQGAPLKDDITLFVFQL